MASLYMDNNATTSLDQKVVVDISNALKENWANPSSLYPIANTCKEKMEQARLEVASMIGGKVSEITFTSCGTESNNIALQSVLVPGKKAHILSTNVEHPSILKYLKMLEETNQAEVNYIDVARKEGREFVEAFVNKLRYDTTLVIAMMANNESGIIHPIEDLGHTLNTMRILGTVESRLKFMIDACQAVGKIKVDTKSLCCDYLTMTGHKFNGPKVGVLWAKEGSPLSPIMHGGGQENGIRPGTENIPMIIGLGTACKLVRENLTLYTAQMNKCRNLFISRMKEEFQDRFHVNNHGFNTLPNTVNFSLDGKLTGRQILDKCPLLMASVGSACNSQDSGVSRVMLMSGFPLDRCKSAIRFSTCRNTTADDVTRAVRMLVQCGEEKLNIRTDDPRHD